MTEPPLIALNDRARFSSTADTGTRLAVKRKWEFPRLNRSGHTPQGGNSHASDSPQGPLRRQGATPPELAPLPPGRTQPTLPDHHPPPQRPGLLPDGRGAGRAQRHRLPPGPALPRTGGGGLLDGREDNGTAKLDERYLDALYRVVRSSPQQHGWRRPTWTRELLVETLARQTDVSIHVATMSRALALIHTPSGRPPTPVDCPWPAAANTRRLGEIQQLLATLPRGHVAVYEDEVDIHLNPKIGLDWMVRGQQKEVRTPGQNVKRYLAGALDVRTGLLTWVEGERKASALFVAVFQGLRAWLL